MAWSSGSNMPTYYYTLVDWVESWWHCFVDPVINPQPSKDGITDKERQEYLEHIWSIV